MRNFLERINASAWTFFFFSFSRVSLELCTAKINYKERARARKRELVRVNIKLASLHISNHTTWWRQKIPSRCSLKVFSPFPIEFEKIWGEISSDSDDGQESAKKIKKEREREEREIEIMPSHDVVIINLRWFQMKNIKITCWNCEFCLLGVIDECRFFAFLLSVV